MSRSGAKWLRRTVIALAASCLAVAGVAGLGVYWLTLSLPLTAGTLSVPGLAKPAEIRRDEHGLVLIRAEAERDAYFALGFAHAQDRLFQMELGRRLGAGRLSEVFGAPTLEVDRLMRVLGLYRLAESSLAHLGPEVQAAFDAYAAGVNAFLATRDRPLPPEYYLLGFRPEPWRPADSLVLGRLLAFQLGANWSDELLRHRLARRLDAERLNALWPALPADDEAAAGPLSPLRAASNGWAVSGRRTASGKPLLANDPHLPLGAPIQWYLARMEFPGLSLAGGTFPGLPFVLVGHNGRVAWGFTTTGGDNQDLFIERLTPGDAGRYESPDGPRPFLTREEVILVDGAPAVSLTVRQTRHGPVISDADESAATVQANEVVALAWTCLGEDDRTAEAFYRMNRAADAGAMVAALRHFQCPVQNAIFAEVDGGIGLVTAGLMPVRKAVFAGSQMPAPGWSGAYDWAGTLAPDELPRTLDPPAGWVANANDSVLAPGYSHFIAARWEPPYRKQRIAELLGGASGLTADDMAAMQADTLSPLARAALPAMLAALGEAPGDPMVERARALLSTWDFRMDRDQAAPLIFVAWLGETSRALYADDVGDLFDELSRTLFFATGRLWADGNGAERWCDDVGTATAETCAERLAGSLATAVGRLAAAYGDRPEDWRWGEAHPARFAHRVWSRVPVLGKWLTPSIAADGGDDTINRAVPAMGSEAGFPDVHGAGLRAIFDLAQLDRSRFIVATGQSGHPLSPHYADLMQRWRDGRYLTMVGIEGDRLTLVPREP